ncbi:N-acetylmuramoyl-L-alanine amidase [Amycolatopsis antarctica]|uniref:N-acetylmuramoyl-L-alanine amidase n=1 Tax=Amycolatopsis antarctica TaxID=1854586 RepID=A0A263D7E9_9PSEU|nr:N-acetylmuramoyl-L-alanine amidase [Amycolatopsis antarctica]OZM73335.1 N-acetylmuramoyl-L-alanine amidase [Amycolatopsis antarctica]
MRRFAPVVLLGLLAAVPACAPDTPERPAAPPLPPVPQLPSPPPAPVPAAPSPPPVPAQPAAPAPVVVLDPGHNGGNADDPAAINRPVPAGRGETKPCNTTGTSTDDGFAEHVFTFDVTQRVAEELRQRGIRVTLTRQDDEGVGPCVDERAAIGNEAGADAVVSIHADGSNSAGANGFHIAHSDPPLNGAQGDPSVRLAKSLREGMTGGGFERATYIGEDGLDGRDDLAGLNLSERPAALVECGNMRDPAEAERMRTPEGRERYAAAIAAGITAYLGR